MLLGVEQWLCLLHDDLAAVDEVDAGGQTLAAVHADAGDAIYLAFALNVGGNLTDAGHLTAVQTITLGSHFGGQRQIGLAGGIHEGNTAVGIPAEAEDALVQLQTSQARIPETEASVAGYRNTLARLTSMPADSLALTSDAGIPTAPSGIAVSIPAETLMRRADVQSAIARIRSSAESLRKAQTDYFPTLSLTGSVGTQAATVGALGASGSGIAALAGALSMPVLNWGTLRAREESAEAALDEAKAGYLSVILKALEETDNALQGIRSAELREGSLAKALQHARRTYELTDLEYRSGIGDYSMLLTAQRSLLNVEESVISNRASRSNQYVMLYRALGGAWDAFR